MDGIRNLVVGYDGSRLSEHALRRALELAGQAPFALVHVVVVGREEDGIVTLPQGPVLPRFAALQLLRLTVDRLVRGWRLQRPHVRQVVQLRYGDAARVIVDTAYRYDADLVLVGAHGDALPHTRLGSVAQQVLDHTHDLSVRVESLSTLATRAPALDEVKGELLATLGPKALDPWSRQTVPQLPS